jgi:hypothetical protein
VRGRSAAGSRWRSHTFADGVHAITLTGRLDGELVADVRARVRQLIVRGHRRVVLDATRIDATATEARRVAELLLQPRGRCRIAVLLPAEIARAVWLPAGVARVATLADARRLCAAPPALPVEGGPSRRDALVEAVVAARSAARREPVAVAVPER